MKYCGIDWANDHHDALSIDEAGRQLESIRVAHSPEGLSQLDTYLERMAGPAGREQIACIVETTHGLLIAHLLEQGWPVYPVNPRTVEKRRAPSGAKTDTIDAYVLAKTGRADFQDLRRLNPDSELFQALPGAGARLAPRLLAELGDDRSRYESASSLQALAGTSPVLFQSGTYQKAHRRLGCIKPWRNALHQFAWQSTHQEAWAKEYYQRKRAEGKSS